MYRVRRHGAAVAATTVLGRGVGSCCRTSYRSYTPIYQPEPASDHLAECRRADELNALWAHSVPAATLGSAVQLWLRYGNDPVVHTSVVPRMPDGTRGTSAAFPSTSGFAYVEDFIGTNLVEQDEQRIRESVELWSSYYEKKYLMRLRQSRRTSANHIGVITAPEVMTDEADQPGTKWSQDTHFREVAFLSERHIKEKVANPLLLEEALVTKATPEQFLAFFQANQQETATRVPLPVPSVWVYEGDAQKAWVERYLPVAKAAYEFFKGVLSADVKKASSPEVVTTAVAGAMKKLHAVLLARVARQVKAGICPEWKSPNTTHAQKLAWTQNTCEKLQRSILEGDPDPEDLLDSSDEWKKEHEAIEGVLNAAVDGCSFTLKEFWTHTLRREELETAHILENDHLRDVAAAAQCALLDELGGDHAAVLAGIEDAVARGYLDLRAATFAPRFNTIFAKLNYAKFGSSAIVQHTNTASRQLLYHYASSPEEVAAAARLYYAAKPMSTKLNYASPYTLRRSLVALCTAYSVDLTHAAQRPFLLGASNLAKAEGTVAQVVRAAAVPYGQARRAQQQQQRAESRRLLSPVSKVTLCEPVSELLDTGADEAAITTPPAVAVASQSSSQAAVKAWPLGSVKVVRYHWPSPQLEKLKFFLQANSGAKGPVSVTMTADKVAELEELKRSGRVEISLWRKRSAAEVEREAAAASRAQKEVETLVKSTPELAQVSTYARQLYSRLSRTAPPPVASAATQANAASGEKSTAAGEPWTFAVMLDDNVPVNEEECASVYVPFTDADGNALPQGEYRVRVRAYAAGAHPALSTEAYSEPFTVFDAVPQLVSQFFSKAGDSANSANTNSITVKSFEGSALVPFCEFLRAAGLDVPLPLEFEAGQGLDIKGCIPMARFLSLLRGNEFHRSRCELGITHVQREIEPDCRAHWELYHPGADAEEWACARRDVLGRAMAHEREWWLQDPLLSVGDTVTGPVSDTGVSPPSYPSTARYGTELCSVLSASGSSLEDEAVPAAPGTIDRRLQAECTVDGTGAITALSFSGPTQEASLDDALQAALAATRRAQDRHCTLSMFKLAPFEKAAQVMSFCGVHGQEFGGKYGRTYCYALDKAKAEMAESLVSGRVVLGADSGSDKARLSEEDTQKADRFASSTHPELRKKLFAGRTTMSGQSLDDPTPDQTSTWNR